MSERTRTLAVGGILLGVLTAGLVVGLLTLGNDRGPSSTTPTTSPPSPTSTDVRAQVEQAYLDAWDVWADSLLRLDSSRLPEAFTGRALQLVNAQVEEQRQKNQPVRVRAEHNYRIDLVNRTTASVDDRYVNHNLRLDPETDEPIDEDPNRREHRSFTMKLVDGTWKIARIIEFR